ncbi:unnamed protein product [Microthlaspi erraticum]|uniref:Pentatricopeptide repeat-containing protein n=1 Tax=Microthlaspi erraticum TaxID=1685480 RepID=A0A6D2JL55_9BRAS|nr:unnamed protein product [Microthlaspi erraticum]
MDWTGWACTVVGRLISLYSKVWADFSTACHLFSRFEGRGIGAWNALLFAYAEHCPSGANAVFAELHKTVTPTQVAFPSLLMAYAHADIYVGHLYAVLKRMVVVYDIEPDKTHMGCIVKRTWYVLNVVRRFI